MPTLSLVSEAVEAGGPFFSALLLAAGAGSAATAAGTSIAHKIAKRIRSIFRAPLYGRNVLALSFSEGYFERSR